MSQSLLYDMLDQLRCKGTRRLMTTPMSLKPCGHLVDKAYYDKIMSYPKWHACRQCRYEYSLYIDQKSEGSEVLSEPTCKESAKQYGYCPHNPRILPLRQNPVCVHHADHKNGSFERKLQRVCPSCDKEIIGAKLDKTCMHFLEILKVQNLDTGEDDLRPEVIQYFNGIHSISHNTNKIINIENTNTNNNNNNDDSDNENNLHAIKIKNEPTTNDSTNETTVQQNNHYNKTTSRISSMPSKPRGRPKKNNSNDGNNNNNNNKNNNNNNSSVTMSNTGMTKDIPTQSLSTVQRYFMVQQPQPQPQPQPSQIQPQLQSKISPNNSNSNNNNDSNNYIEEDNSNITINDESIDSDNTNSNSNTKKRKANNDGIEEKAEKKQRKCKYCNKPGHNVRTCEMLREDEMRREKLYKELQEKQREERGFYVAVRDNNNADMNTNNNNNVNNDNNNNNSSKEDSEEEDEEYTSQSSDEKDDEDISSNDNNDDDNQDTDDGGNDKCNLDLHLDEQDTNWLQNFIDNNDD
jgi:hypothetical protein